jgi:hemerythrin
MAAHRCSAAEANRLAHDAVRADLARIKGRIAKEGINSIDVVQLELILGNWIRNHICTIDIKLRECINRET